MTLPVNWMCAAAAVRANHLVTSLSGDRPSKLAPAVMMPLFEPTTVMKSPSLCCVPSRDTRTCEEAGYAPAPPAPPLTPKRGTTTEAEALVVEFGGNQ